MASVELATQRKETEEPIGAEQTPSLVIDLKGNLDGSVDNEFTAKEEEKRKSSSKVVKWLKLRS